MRRILSLIAVVALMVAFAMPVVTADAASHAEKNPCNPCAAKKMMEKGEGEGAKAMDKMKGAHPCNPCAAKKANPCNPCAAKKANPCNPCATKK